METIIRKILKLVEDHKIDKHDAKELLKDFQGQFKQFDQEIAVIGMAGKFPEAENLEEFWENLVQDRRCVTSFSEYRRRDTDEIIKSYLGSRKFDAQKAYKRGGFLKQIDKFDADFFRISPREAALIDPSHRLFLEIAWEAIADAGLAGQRLVGSNTGVFVGKDHSGGAVYKKMISESDVLVATGSWPGILASRLAYIFDFQGPCLVIDTACSSGLVAVHQACQAIKNRECELAIAGGVFVEFVPAQGSQLGVIESPEATIRSFDKAANGTIWGEGVGAILLKPAKKALADGDPIHAIIKSSAINNDGASNGITAPKAEAQEKVILKAWEKMQISPETISYVETHGTGTVLGDPIEVKGLSNAFRYYTDKKQFCGIGSCKTNIGHLVGASGLAALIKVILSLKHGLLPASLNFHEPNPYIDFSNSPLYVNDRLQKWQVTGHPRRAGVSAFGFSGTNCHLVLEEAPTAKVLASVENQPLLLTISARSKEVLSNLVERYHLWLAGYPEVNLADFCYTLNTGRGHFGHRLALIVKDFKDLLAKLSYLLHSGLTSNQEMGIYYAEHRVVNMNKRDRQPGELTKAEERELSKTGAEYLLKLREQAIKQKEVALIYVQGADINWEELYIGQKRQRLHLPTYPFARVRHWVEFKVPQEYSTEKKPMKEIAHPLLDRCLLDSLYQKVYLTEFSVEEHWVLQEHKILGNYVLPGTTYLELIREAVKEDYPEGELELGDIYFLTPLIVSLDEKRKVQTIIDRRNGQMEFTVASQDELTGEWLIHVQGKVAGAQRPEKTRYDLEVLKARFLKSEDVEAKELKDGPIELGPRWANLRKIYYNEDEVMIFLSINEEFGRDLEKFLIHPAMMDTAVNALSQSQGEGVYLPFSYKSLRIYRPMPEKFYSYMQKSDIEQKNQEMFAADITLIDQSGEIFAEITDYRVKKVRARDLKKSQNLYYGVNWLEKPLATNNRRDLADQKVLLLQGAGSFDQKLLLALDALGWTVYQAKYGPAYVDHGFDKYTITGSEDDYRTLLTQLKNKGLTMVLHLMSLQTVSNFYLQPTEEQDLKHFVEIEKQGVKDLFYLTRALSKIKLATPLELYLITEGVNSISGQEVICPHNASLIGLGKVIGQEVENIIVRAIDVGSDFDVKDLLSEIRTVGQPYQVSYRQGKRYVEEITSIKLQELPVKETEIHSSGVYLITGGTGGIGLEIAKYLAQDAKPNIALISRNPLPAPEKWDEIIASQEENKLSKKLSIIRQIEAQGARVLTYAVNVASYLEMQSLLVDLRKNFGRINGVIHAAGVAGDGFLQLKAEAVFEEVMRPKMVGTWILDQLTRVDMPDFFILCSSIASLVAGPGQGDYVAANSYLDAYAEYRNQLGFPTATINWSAWKETGMAFDYQLNTDQAVFKGLTTKEAMAAFSEIIEHQVQRIIVGQLNYQHELFAQTDILPILFTPDIKEKIVKYRRRSLVSKGQSKNQIGSKVVQLKGKTAGDYSALETKLASIWGEILVLNEVDIYEDFYALGGDSIIAIKLSNAIKAVTKLEIDTSDIFQYQTISDLADYLSQHSHLPKMSKEVADESQAIVKPFASMVKEIEVARKKDYPVIKKTIEKEYYQTSSAQKRMYVLQQFDLKSTSYNLPGFFEISGYLDLEKAEYAFSELLKRHEALRTSFKTLEGQIVQKIEQDVLFQVGFSEQGEKPIPEIIREFIRPFDLSQAPLFRVEQIELAADKFLLMFDMHHIITDGISLQIVVKEFAQLYAGQKLAAVKFQYKDYAEWQNSLLSSEYMREKEAFWIERFSDQLPVLNLPTDFPRPNVQSFAGKHLTCNLDQQLTRDLKRLAKKIGCTMYMVLLSGINILLAKYSGQEDIIIGSPIAGRSHVELEDTIGIFINTLAMRNYPHGEKNYTEFLKEVKDNAIQAYKNQDYQFEELVDRLNLRRDISRNPLFDVMFVMQNFSTQELKELRFQDNKLKPLENLNNTAKFDLEITANEVKKSGNAEEIVLDFQYRTDLFRTDTIGRMSSHLEEILVAITRDQEYQLNDIQILTAKERYQLLNEFNDTSADYPAEKTICQLFFEQVNRRADQLAVSFHDQKLTYRELAQRVIYLAQILQSKGVKPETIVGIMMPRSLDMLIGIFGILAAGGVYLPINPEYPEERISFMLEDSGAHLLLTNDQFTKKAVFSGETITPNSLAVKAEETFQWQTVNRSTDLAYVIYTSGSTGRPKGVMVEHRSVINRLHWMQRAYPLNETDVIMQKTTITFDVSVWELFWWSFVGAQLTLLSAGGEKDPEKIINCIQKHQVTVMHFVPSMLYSFLQYIAVEKHEESLESLRQVFCSGEVLQVKHVELFKNLVQKKNNPRLINLYGPTEATVDVSYYECLKMEKLMNVPIGKPIDNIDLYIVDPKHRLQPIGVVGELCIAGVGLARGYLNNPELTANKFVENPFRLAQKNQNDKMYKTGDLARWLPDGNIEFCGRVDHQVKIRGFRIELGEIEATLLQHEKVKETVVIARSLTEESADKKLLAYVVLKEEVELDITDFRNYLLKKLPEFSVPQIYLQLKKLPRKTNGKIDLAALPNPDQQRTDIGKSFQSPKTATEKILADIWSELLGKEKISVHDNFFNLGGDSILGIQVVARGRKVGFNYSIRELYQYPTIQQLAMNLDEASRAEAAVSAEAEIQDFGLLSAEDSEKLQKLFEKSPRRS